jgi:hypothetical protein
MVPLWATILVGLTAGVLGTLLTISHERGAEIPARMLEAADDYLQGLFAMATGLRSLRLALDAAERPPQAEIAAIREQIQEAADRLDPQRGRIPLLFGKSHTLAVLLEVSRAIEELRKAYESWEAKEPNGKARVETAEDVAGAAIAKFAQAARRDLRYGMLSRLIDRLGRMVHTPVHTPPLENAD